MSNSLVSLEVVNFREEMDRVEKEVLKMADATIDERIDYATETLRTVTPVDTGKARSGWENTKTNLSIENEDKGTIFNNVEYISFLNQGTSKQAPKYFIEQVLITIGILTN
jgi:uncharacterized protein (UPF0333 family)